MSKNLSACDEIVFMVSIVKRGAAEKLAEFYKTQGVTFNLICLGRGTASSEMLNYLGLEETEKDIMFSTMAAEESDLLMQKLIHQMRFDKPGHGIAFTIPISSVGGAVTLKYLSGVHENKGSECKMASSQKDLVITIVNHGHTDDVMEAARSASATGGTILHARVAGLAEAERFFGISIQPEKEMIFILVDSSVKQEVMTAICKKAGLNTEAKAMSFSLPVNHAVGLVDDLQKQA